MVLSMDRWIGKIAVVTGASSGIGAAIAKILVENGIIVAGIGRRVEKIKNCAQQISHKTGKLYGVKADITNEEEILNAFKWIVNNLGPVHILVNSAGWSKEGLLTEGVTEFWRKVFDTNVMALCIATREAIKIMKCNEINGHIIHINSVLGHSIKNVSGVNVYPASKYAVTALTETMIQELIQLNSKIKVTSVSPGFVVTELTLLRDDISEERRKFFSTRPSMTPEDVADAVLYALSTPEHLQVHEITIKPIGEPC